MSIFLVAKSGPARRAASHGVQELQAVQHAQAKDKIAPDTLRSEDNED